MSLKPNEGSIPIEYCNIKKMNITTYNQLEDIKQIELSVPTNELELGLITQYCSSLEKIIIIGEVYSSINKHANILKGLDVKLEIKLDPKKLYNLADLRLFSTFFPNSYILYGYEDVTIHKFINVYEKLDSMIKPIKNVELSPLEKFLYIFYITSHFRKYKDVKYNEDKSRSLFELFDPDNNQIVCGGFSKILMELCKRINILALKMYVHIYVVDNECIQFDCGHFRNIVRLTDNKYKINGIYISDATWNNIMNKDLLTTAIMTPLESLSISNYRLGLNGYDILSTQNYEEFCHIIYRDFKYNDAKDFNKTLNALLYLFPELEKLLSNTNIQSILKSNKTLSKESCFNLINDKSFMITLYNFISNVCNQPVDGLIIIEAMVNLKKKLNPQMTHQELEKYKNSLLNQNYIDYEIMFPPLVAQKNNENKMILENIQNKFAQGPRKI